MERNSEMFVYSYGLACLAIVMMSEAIYILQFATNNITIDQRQFDLLLIVFSLATVVGGLQAWHYGYYDLASILMLIGILEAMFGYIEYIEGSIMTITFIDYIFTALMVISAIILALNRKIGISILTALCALTFFSFNLNKMFGVSDVSTSWCVVIFGMLAGVWCMFLIVMKYLESSGMLDIGLFDNTFYSRPVKSASVKKKSRKA